MKLFFFIEIWQNYLQIFPGHNYLDVIFNLNVYWSFTFHKTAKVLTSSERSLGSFTHNTWTNELSVNTNMLNINREQGLVTTNNLYILTIDCNLVSYRYRLAPNTMSYMSSLIPCENLFSRSIPTAFAAWITCLKISTRWRMAWKILPSGDQQKECCYLWNFL